MNRSVKIDVAQVSAAVTNSPRVDEHRRSNLFTPLRLLAAGAVLFGHAFALTGHDGPAWFGNGVGAIGVKIFFVISGLLVTRSWMADPRPTAFAVRRALRIMPGLIGVVLLSAFVLGPVITALPLKEYFRSPGVIAYLRNILLYPVYALPGVFASNPYPVAVNGSLWSLPVEVVMYILTPFIAGRTQEKAKLAAAVAMLMSVAFSLYLAHITPIKPQPVFYGTGLTSMLDVAPYFQIGAVCAVFRLDRFARPAFSALLLVALAIALNRIAPIVDAKVISQVVLMIALPFAVVSVGAVQVGGGLAKVLARSDLSYGLYLYGFPVEQLISMVFKGHINGLQTFALSIPITLACAFASWKLVEQPALQFKPRKAAPSIEAFEGARSQDKIAV